MRQHWAEIEHTSQGMKFTSSYNKNLIADFKIKIPYSKRNPSFNNGKFQYWLVDPSCEQDLIDLCQMWLGVEPDIIGRKLSAPQKQTRLLDVRYIGSTKDQDGEFLARGLVGGEWHVVFPQDVLEDWFENGVFGLPSGKNKPIPQSYYSVLMVQKTATQDEIKRAYRKMAKRYHPDINKDQDAPERFRAVKEAYDVLGDSEQRAQWDFGLMLEATAGTTQGNKFQTAYYTPPTRCGFILATGIEKLGLFYVEAILQWQEITNGLGRTLVTSWDSVNNELVEKWI